MTEAEVDEKYTQILKEMGASDSVIKEELLKPIQHKYNNVKNQKVTKEFRKTC